MLAVFTTLLSFFLFDRAGPHSMIAIPALVLTLWGGIFLMHLHHERLKGQSSKLNDQRADIAREKAIIEKDLSFYEQKKADQVRQTQQRRQLVVAARALGSCLDPNDLQQKLIETAQTMFPGKKIEITTGSGPNPNDTLFRAAPIKAQGAVAGRLAVRSTTPFTQDETRLLDILGSLASLALENSTLFHQIQESALRDNLTGLWTHKAFQEHLEQAMLEASRYGHTLSVILTDVDHFKSVNDTYGHQAGDAVLQGFAHVLVRHVRDVDVVARYGGEEFIILLLQTSQEEAQHTAEAIRADLESQRFSAGSSVISVTGSFGVATFPHDATSAQQLIRTADERLYAAKRGGRNQVRGRAA